MTRPSTRRISPRRIDHTLPHVRHGRSIQPPAASVRRLRQRSHAHALLITTPAPVRARAASWLEIPTGDGWVAAYRLAHSGSPRARKTHILELRLFPDDGGARLPGEWPGMWQGVGAESRKAFSFAAVHRLVKERVFNTSLAAIERNLAGREIGEQPGVSNAMGGPSEKHAGSPREGKGAGRKGRPDAFYAQVAVEYHRTEHDPRREAGESTRKTLAQRHHKPESTIAKWLQVAGAKGFLTHVGPGERRRMATAAARRVATGG